MAQRGELHHRHLGDFRAWLDAQGIEHRDARGAFQVMQVKQGREWRAVYHRSHAPEHVSVPRDLYPLVRRFLRERKAKGEEA